MSAVLSANIYNFPDPRVEFLNLALSISEQNAADNCLSKINCNPFQKYRSIDGTCNNLLVPGWGTPNTAFVRLLPPSYSDGKSFFLISLIIFGDTGNL